MFLVTNLYFSVFILSLLVLVDVLVKFKRPFILKFYFTILIFSIAVISLIFALNASKLFFLVSLFKAFTMVAFLNIYFRLFSNKFNIWIFVLSSLIIFTSVALVVFYLNSNIHEPDMINEMPQTIGIYSVLGSNNTIFLKIIRLLLFVFFIATLAFFSYTTSNTKGLNNIYFKKIKIWTYFIFIISIVLVIINLILSFFNPSILLMHILFNIHYMYVLILVLYRPAFLNRSALKISLGEKFNQDAIYPINESDFVYEFYTKLYFANPDASLEHFASKMGINANELYLFIYYKYSLSFLDLVNKNRIAYFLDIIQDPKFQNYTIEALAKEVGFSSRQHLYKPFKKFHGGQPSDVIDAASGL